VFLSSLKLFKRAFEGEIRRVFAADEQQKRAEFSLPFPFPPKYNMSRILPAFSSLLPAAQKCRGKEERVIQR
jgi:hypothetical protein